MSLARCSTDPGPRLRGAELELAFEHFLEEFLAIRGRVESEGQIRVCPGLDLQYQGGTTRPAGEVGDDGCAGSIEGDGDAQEAGQGSYDSAIFVFERCEFGMLCAWGALAVVPGDDRDDLDLVIGESHEVIGMADHVVGVPVVLVVRNDEPDVRKQGRSFEDFALRISQPMLGGERVEEE